MALIFTTTCKYVCLCLCLCLLSDTITHFINSITFLRGIVAPRNLQLNFNVFLIFPFERLPKVFLFFDDTFCYFFLFTTCWANVCFSILNYISLFGFFMFLHIFFHQFADNRKNHVLLKRFVHKQLIESYFERIIKKCVCVCV